MGYSKDENMMAALYDLIYVQVQSISMVHNP